MSPSFDDVVKFHGHSCPGLAIGYRMACAAMQALSAFRSEDEEVVAIVENNSCGVDAVQCVAGCTFGKGNLIFLDYGKQVYTLYSRATRRGVRVSFHGKEIPEGMRDDRAAFIKWILNAPAKSIIHIEEVLVDEPEAAQIHRSVQCAFCGESVMETRTRQIDGKPACIPCSRKHKQTK